LCRCCFKEIKGKRREGFVEGRVEEAIMHFSIFSVLKQLDKDMMVWMRINE
jgi:hypothetical protein